MAHAPVGGRHGLLLMTMTPDASLPPPPRVSLICDAEVKLHLTSLVCDRDGGHQGRHGGAYPGDSPSGPVDVFVEWS